MGANPILVASVPTCTNRALAVASRALAASRNARHHDHRMGHTDLPTHRLERLVSSPEAPQAGRCGSSGRGAQDVLTLMTLKFCPERLSLIRERRGLSISRLAAKAEVAERAIRSYEAGETTPRESNLGRLAAALSVPPGYFFGPRISGLGNEAATFRAATKLPAYRRRAALAAGSIAMYLADWFAHRFDLPIVNVPEVTPGSDPDLAAQSVRAAWGLGNGPAPNMLHLLEAMGVLVFSLADDCKELDAFSYWRHGRPFVMLNTAKSAERGRFDLAHELGHLVLHREIQRTTQAHEDEANAFAAAFLMPRSGIMAMNLFMPTLSELIESKTAWQVAATALARRLHDLDVLSDWHYRTTMIELSKRGYRSSEPDGIQPEASQLLTVMLQSLRSEGVSVKGIAKDLHMYEADVADMLVGLVPAIGVMGR